MFSSSSSSLVCVNISILHKKGFLYALVGRTKPRDTRASEETSEIGATRVCVSWSLYLNLIILGSDTIQNQCIWCVEMEDGL